MKALILAAGKGTRLLPLTADRPKVMIEFNGKPLLWYHVQLLKYYGVSEIWINTYWFPQSIFDYFGDGALLGIKINYSHETELLGTAGSLKNPDTKIAESLSTDSFIITQGDNVTNFNYQKLINFHLQRQAFMSLGLFESPEPWTQGVVETDSTGRVIKLVEKPPKEQVTTNQVNAGVYVCNPGLLDLIPEGFSDFGFDIFPKMLSLNLPVYALSTGDYVQDMGTPDRLIKAQTDFPTLHFPFK